MRSLTTHFLSKIRSFKIYKKMAKKAPKKESIKKKEFSVTDMRNNLGLDKLSVKDKPLSYIPFAESYREAVGLPGIARGYVTLFRGFSDTGKSTSVYEAVVGCQKIGDLAVIIDTENSWSWDHAKEIGVKFEEVVDKATGEIVDYVGDFLYINNDALLLMYGYFDYGDAKVTKTLRGEAVNEDVARFVNELLDSQMNGELPRPLCIMWDSIGSIDCFKSWKSKSRNNMWNAGSLESSFKSIINHRIPASRKEGKEFTNTFLGVQKIWIDSMQGAGVIKHKGGEAFYYGARQIVHMGGIQSHGTSSLLATSAGNNYAFGTKAKIKIVKNQIGGVTWEGQIASTPHGFINPDKKNDYVAEHREYLLSKLDLTDGDIEIKEEQPSDESIKDMFVS